MLYSLHMTPIKATITSKNQITLPVKLVRKYKLDKNRVVIFTDKNGVIEIHPQPSIKESMAPIWKAMHTHLKDKPVLTEEEFSQAVHQSFADRWDKPNSEGRT
jgi:bifunctional DNA-binding transcriptional regulator/antitoxin component of YhaV-PrlF toxin-antitoxin module